MFPKESKSDLFSIKQQTKKQPLFNGKRRGNGFPRRISKRKSGKKVESEKSKRKSTWQISSQVQNVFRLVTNCKKVGFFFQESMPWNLNPNPNNNNNNNNNNNSDFCSTFKGPNNRRIWLQCLPGITEWAKTIGLRTYKFSTTSSDQNDWIGQLLVTLNTVPKTTWMLLWVLVTGVPDLWHILAVLSAGLKVYVVGCAI